MQIHELNNYSGDLNDSAYMAIDNGTDTGKLPVKQLTDPINETINELDYNLNARIDNIIAGGTAPSAAEVTDARLGGNDILYASLGAAIRGQYKDLDSFIKAITVIGVNQANYKNAVQGYFIDHTTGVPTANATHKMIQWIPVKPNTGYIFGLWNGAQYGNAAINNGARIAFYSTGSVSDFISGKILQSVGDNILTTPNNCEFISLSWNDNSGPFYPMLAEGNTLPDYELYTVSVDTSALDAYTRDQANWRFNIYDTAVHPYKKLTGSLSDGGVMTIATALSSFKKNLNLVFAADISSFNSITIGYYHQLSGTLHERITINQTRIIVAGGGESYAHGLNIQNNIQVLIEKRYNLTADVTVISNGESFKVNVGFYDHTQVCQPFVSSDGSSLTNCLLTWMNGDARKPIYMFGDSYFNYSPSRWMYYVDQYGYIENLMIDGFPGESSNGSLIEFKTAIGCGNPRFAVWCSGMNDYSDVGTTPNPSWKANTEEFIQLCLANNITPVLATIPTTPNKNNEGKNVFVKSSGYRYIDFAKAVGAGAGGVWYAGMLSSDNVHPTETGARALFMQALADFPEIMLAKQSI